MRLLLTNDDGIHAPGLQALAQELKSDYEIEIVAPESEMSAVGHGVSLHSPLRVQTVRKDGAFWGYAVNGTPADCVKIAVQELLKRPPDFILSGINLGANVGINLLYSGTVSAAIEGAFLGIKSAAVSLAAGKEPDFRFAAQFSRKIIAWMTSRQLRDKTALNVNIPALSWENIKGIAITRQAQGQNKERYERRIDPRGNVYYWLAGDPPGADGVPDSDAGALREGKISITPIDFDLTCHEEFARLKGCPLPDLKV